MADGDGRSGVPRGRVMIRLCLQWAQQAGSDSTAGLAERGELRLGDKRERQ